MSKKILIISTSLRKGGNSEKLADEFMRGAVETGHVVQKISLIDKDITFCTGCLACQKTKRCVIHDDADMLTQKMLSADVLVFATPIYYYEMSGQMKTVLDRANPLYASDYTFRDVYLLATSADEDVSAMDGAIKGLEGWISCFKKVKLAGVIKGLGADGVGTMVGNPALKEAYKAGKLI